MCKHGTTEKVLVKIPADLSCTEKEEWREMGIDKCIAPLVRALQEGGIDMSSSCCGHGRPLGDIQLQDGRILLIDTYGEWAMHRNRLLLKALWCHFIYPKRVRLRVAKNNFLWKLKKLSKGKKGLITIEVKNKMSIADEIDKLDDEMEKEYQEIFPPKKRRFTFTEVREKYLRRKDGKIKSR